MDKKQLAIREIINQALKQKPRTDYKLRKIKAEVIPRFGLKILTI